jgi:clan AA aspartic protease
MIIGTVNGRYEIVFKLPIRDSFGSEHQIEAVLDTGFTGSLTLPPSLIATLKLPWRTRTRAVLADGSVQQLDVYTAIVVWDGSARPVFVEAIDNVPLIGMKLLVGYDLRARVRIGGSAEIEAIP